MEYDITNDFKEAANKGLKVLYNDTSGDFEIVCKKEDETISFYDDEAGEGKEAARQFIAEY